MAHAFRTINHGRHFVGRDPGVKRKIVNDPPSEDDEYDHDEDIRQIVAQLSVSDFIYTVPVVAQGGATREVRGALLFSNGMGVILQMKARQSASRGEDGSAWVTRRGGRRTDRGKAAGA
jgi:hypothetical protein